MPEGLALDIRDLGRVPYLPTWQAMESFSQTRAADTPDALWLCEHDPVFTQGLSGKAEHVLAAGDIPIVQSNRGGQVTYHGPGQVVAYPLIDLRRTGYFVKEYVHRLEEAVLRTLAHFQITGHRVRSAPGIYVRLDDPYGHAPLLHAGKDANDASAQHLFATERMGKVAALGIKVSRHCTFHGVAFNVSMDLEPFTRINPCGYSGLATVDLRSLGVDASLPEVKSVFTKQLLTWLCP